MLCNLVCRFRLQKMFSRFLNRRTKSSLNLLRRNRRHALSFFEGLEERRLLSTFMVSNVIDDENEGSLRWALTQANYHYGPDTINFDPSVFATPQTISLGGSQLGLSDSTGAIAIIGPAAGVTISGNNTSRVFVIDANASANLSGLTISGGKSEKGGGVYVYDQGTLTLTNCTISGNTANIGSPFARNYGGGVFNNGTAMLTSCTLSGNSAFVHGGGMFNSGTVLLINCTLSGNYARGGGGMTNTGTATLTNCTFSRNTASEYGGGLFNIGLATLTNTLVSGNAANSCPEAYGTFNSQGHNLIGSTQYNSGWIATDLIGVDPRLDPLGNNGGPTQTMALLPGSPAIYAGTSTGAPSTDQRGYTRFAGTDIGAFQFWTNNSVWLEPSTYTVSNLLDDGSTGSLRWALTQANYHYGPDTINFDPSVFATPQTISLGGSQLGLSDSTGAIAIIGPAAGVTISGNNTSRVFVIDANASANLSGLTISGGRTDHGGGVLNMGTVTLTNSTLSGNSAQTSGGMLNIGTATFMNCTISGNYARGGGGGVFNSGNATLTNCTLSRNYGNYGGGLCNNNAVAFSNCTISGNTSTLGGGVCNLSTATLTNTLVYGNAANTAPEAYGTFNSQGHNLIGSTQYNSGWIATDLIGVDPRLDPLGNNGGPTQTMALLPGSPAIYAGTSTSAPSTDQRGFARLGGIDIGAFQYGATDSTTTTLASSSNPSTYGISVTFTATVPDGVTGTVTFKDGSTILGTSVINGGTTTFSTSALTAGSHSITFVYGGDGNYTISNALNQTVNKANVTVTGITASSKVYDSTATATLATGSAMLSGVVTGDVVTLNTSGTTGTFTNKSVGNEKIVQVAGLTLSGAAAANYTLVQPKTTADITPLTVTVTPNPISKVYDGTVTAYVTYSGWISGDAITVNSTSAKYGSKYAGTGKAVNIKGISLSGADAGNYMLVNTKISTTGTITKATLIVSPVADNKAYDQTTAATIRLTDNRIAGDMVNLVYTSARFASKTAGNGKTVNITGIYVTGGVDSGSYTLASHTATTTANITPLTLTGYITASNKVYDGTTAATLTNSSIASGVLPGDTVAIVGCTATFDTKNVGTVKTVTATGFSLGGPDGANYSIGTVTTTATITSKTIVGTVTVADKVFDNSNSGIITSRTLFGVVEGDDVKYLSGTSFEKATFSDKHVGTAKTATALSMYLGGSDAANYSVNSGATATANISPYALTVTALGSQRVYDGTTDATVLLSCNSVPGSTLTLLYTSASFADKNVGNNKPVSVTGIQLSGPEALDYTFNSTASTTGNITQRTLVITTTAADKKYDGTKAATVTSLLDDRVLGDDITLSYAAASFAAAAIADNITVTVGAISPTGADRGNYKIPGYVYTTANITV